MCSFCSNYEIIHLFFGCALTKFIWRVVYLVSGLTPSNNIRHMFGAWVHGMNSSNTQIFLVGIRAMLWVIWLSRTDMVFNKVTISSSMQVIFRGTHWTRTWTKFQKESKRKLLRTICHLIETMTMEIFVRHGWWSTSRLSLWWISILLHGCHVSDCISAAHLLDGVLHVLFCNNSAKCGT
jgi:hypothetical protein